MPRKPMAREARESRIVVLVTRQEKAEYNALARELGYDSVGAMVRALVRLANLKHKRRVAA